LVKRALWGCAVVGGVVALAAVLLAAFGLLGGEPRQALPVIAIVPSESPLSTSGSAGPTTSTSAPEVGIGAHGDATASPVSGRETVAGPMRYQGNAGEGRERSGGGPGSTQGGGR